jgi:hypothetical protein
VRVVEPIKPAKPVETEQSIVLKHKPADHPTPSAPSCPQPIDVGVQALHPVDVEQSEASNDAEITLVSDGDNAEQPDFESV